MRLATKTDMDAGPRVTMADIDAEFAALKLHIETAGRARTKLLMATIVTTAGLSIAILMFLLYLFPPR
ncbi:MAG: hypothetical protein ACRYGM_23150 [Janthinobacterium lividum]